MLSTIFAICFIYAVRHKVPDHKDMTASHFDLLLLDTAHNAKYITGPANLIHFVFTTFYIKINIPIAWV